MNAISIPALSAIALKKSFGGVPAVKGISFDVGSEEVVAIIGPNGAGKSTCFDLLTGRKTPDSGRVHLFGEDVSRMPPWHRVKRGLGRSFQVSSVFPTFSVRENVQVGMMLSRGRSWSMFGRAQRCFRSDAEDILEKVGLAEKRNVLAGELSYGDRRTVELAVALSTKPKILLLDEPTAGMGREESRECLRHIRAIAANERIPIVFVEHDMDVVFSFATRVIVLADGQLLIDSDPETVRSNERVREVYFGEDI
jgi:branched-chain amino acid transport system ATP-binding protein